MDSANPTGVNVISDATHWEELQRLFDLAGAAPAAERERVLVEACGDAEVRQRVMALLDVSEQTVEARPQGQRIGPYGIIGTIGSGGVGTVYCAERAIGGAVQRVALKVLAPHAAGASFIDRFAREQEILATLDHPGITRLLDAGLAENGQPYLAMELVDGQHLTAYCKAHTLDIPARLALFLDICGAVEHAHQSGVVHLDLKPSNILVTGAGVVKLLDFGTAKLLQPDGTFTAPIMATPAYASPEQMRGEAVTKASDVYSLGAVLRELAGQGAEGDVSTIARKCMRGDPRERYASVAALAADIERYVQGRPVLARPQTLVYRAGKMARRHRWNLAVAGLSMAAIAGVAEYSSWKSAQASRQQVEILRQSVESEYAAMLTYGSWFYSAPETNYLDRVRKTVEGIDPKLLTPGLHYILGTSYMSLGRTYWSPYQASRLMVDESARAYRTAMEHFRMGLAGAGDTRRAFVIQISETAMRLAEEGVESGQGLQAYAPAFGPLIDMLHAPRDASTLAAAGADFDMLSDRLGKKTAWRAEELRPAPANLRELAAMPLSRATDLAAVENYQNSKGMASVAMPLVDLQLGRLLAESGHPEEGRRLLESASAACDAHRKSALPDAAPWTSRFAGAQAQLGRIDESEGQNARALERYSTAREAIEEVHKTQKQPYYADRVAVARMNAARMLVRLGRSREALPLARSAADLFREEASDARTPAERLELAAYYLLTVEPREARDPKAARNAAAGAVERSARRMPSYLVTLAVAEFMNGQNEKAEADASEAEALYRAILPSWSILFAGAELAEARRAFSSIALLH